MLTIKKIYLHKFLLQINLILSLIFSIHVSANENVDGNNLNKNDLLQVCWSESLAAKKIAIDYDGTQDINYLVDKYIFEKEGYKLNLYSKIINKIKNKYSNFIDFQNEIFQSCLIRHDLSDQYLKSNSRVCIKSMTFYEKIYEFKKSGVSERDASASVINFLKSTPDFNKELLPTVKKLVTYLYSISDYEMLSYMFAKFKKCLN